MAIDAQQSAVATALPTLAQIARPSVADQVFDVLLQRILTLELPPGSKMSETEVAGQMGVSRQPVREAFKRLARQDFLLIRPQRSTTVSLISEAAVLRARFIRTALEIHACKSACETLTDADLKALSDLIEAQKSAIGDQDKETFHALDDQFHREICNRSGVGYVWDLIHDSKAHMDRIRMLSLNFTSQQYALVEHTVILEAISQRDPIAASEAMNTHLSRILILIDEIKTENHQWFMDNDE